MVLKKKHTSKCFNSHLVYRSIGNMHSTLNQQTVWRRRVNHDRDLELERRTNDLRTSRVSDIRSVLTQHNLRLAQKGWGSTKARSRGSEGGKGEKRGEKGERERERGAWGGRTEGSAARGGVGKSWMHLECSRQAVWRAPATTTWA